MSGDGPSILAITTGESPIAPISSRTVRWDIASFANVKKDADLRKKVDFGFPVSMRGNVQRQTVRLSKDPFDADSYSLTLLLDLAKDVKVKGAVTISSGEPRVERRLERTKIVNGKSIISSFDIAFSLAKLGTFGKLVRRTNRIRIEVDISIVSERTDCSRLISAPGPTLANALGACLVSDDLKELSDVELIDRDDGSHPAHRLFLSVRSPVFRATFRHDMQESRTGRVSVDASPDAVKQLLKFIYTDEIDNLRSNEDLLVEVFSLGCLYTLPRLGSLAEMQMKDTLTIDNVSGRLLLAVRHNSPLKEECIAMVRSNMSEIVKTEGWAEITKDAMVMAALMSNNDSCHDDDDDGQRPNRWGGRPRKRGRWS